MRKIIQILFLLPLFFYSCQYVEKKVPSEQELLQKQLKEINWKEVDEYPSIESCEEIQNKAQKKACFFEFITNTLQQRLGADSLDTSSMRDTIDIKVTVFPEALIKFEPQFSKDSLPYNKKRTDSLIQSKLIDFPKISPALKRGIPVKTQFTLPVIVKVQN
jgi:hypothetical protein